VGRNVCPIFIFNLRQEHHANFILNTANNKSTQRCRDVPVERLADFAMTDDGSHSKIVRLPDGVETVHRNVSTAILRRSTIGSRSKIKWVQIAVV